MGKKVQLWRWLGVILLLFSISGCQKPQLRSERSKDGEKEILKGSAEYYREIRKGIIGQTFETLTLGSRQFSNAEVRGITDQVIEIAHAGGVDRVEWSEVTDEVREQWGYNPAAKSLVARIKQILPEDDDPPEKESAGESKLPAKAPAKNPKLELQNRVKELARKEKMLEAQLEGIRRLESDLARHSAPLNELRRQLQSIRAQQSRKRSGGLMVERINGQSTVVDRRQEAREIESKIKVEEQLVAQFSKSLQTAKAQYLEMKREVDQLRRQ